MATLKIRTSFGFDWVTDVETVSTGHAWVVKATDFEFPDKAIPEGGSRFGGYNTIHHSIAPTQMDDTERETKMAVEVLVGTSHDPAQDGQRFTIHVFSQCEGWLMDDKGRTIDRIP